MLTLLNIANNATAINNVNVKVDGVKGDLKDLTAKVEQNTKDINVAGTIAIETVNSLAITKLLLQITKLQLQITLQISMLMQKLLMN